MKRGYYASGIVHLRNLESMECVWDPHEVVVIALPGLLTEAEGEPQWSRHQHRIIDPAVPESFDAALSGCQSLVLSKTFGEAPLYDLTAAALRAQVPTVAIQEVNQSVLTSSRLNTCWFPSDVTCVASPLERDAFLGQGFDPHRVRVTGLPFSPPLFAGGARPSPERPFHLLLALSRLDESADGGGSGETPEVRSAILGAISPCLGSGLLLKIKPHPRDSEESFRRFVPADSQQYVEILDRMAPMRELIPHALAVLTRGNSQVLLEALSYGVPAIAIPAGIHVPFEDSCPGAVVRTTCDLERILEQIKEGSPPDYRQFTSSNITQTPRQAAEAIASITKSLEEKARKSEPLSAIAVELLAAFGSREHMRPAQRLGSAKLPVRFGTLKEAALRLIRLQASVADVRTLLDEVPLPSTRPVVLALWARVLKHSPVRHCDRAFALFHALQRDFPNEYAFTRDFRDAAELWAQRGGGPQEMPGALARVVQACVARGQVLNDGISSVRGFYGSLKTELRRRRGLDPFYLRNSLVAGADDD